MNKSTEPRFNVLQSAAMCAVVTIISVVGVFGVMSNNNSDNSTDIHSHEITYQAIQAANPTNIDIQGIEFATVLRHPGESFRLRATLGSRWPQNLTLTHQNANGDTLTHCGLRGLESRAISDSVLVLTSPQTMTPSKETITQCLAITLSFAKQAYDAWLAQQDSTEQARQQAQAHLQRLYAK